MSIRNHKLCLRARNRRDLPQPLPALLGQHWSMRARRGWVRSCIPTAALSFITALRLSAFVWLPASALTTPTVAETRELRLSHQWVAEGDARDRAARVFVDEVQKRIANLRISIVSTSSLGVKPPEQLNEMLKGRIDMTVYPLFYGSPYIPELAISLLPGIPASSQMGKRLKDTRFHEQLQSLAELHGVHILTWWWLGGGFASRNREIALPGSVQGLTARGGDKSFDLMLTRAGGRVSVMPSNDISGKMASGELDLALTSYESLVSYRIFQYAKFATFGGYGLWTSLQPIIISKTEWQKLSYSEQAAFAEAAEISNAFFEGSQSDAEQKAIKAFTEAGATVRTLSFEEYRAWLELARESSWRDYESISLQAQDLLSEMMISFIESGDEKLPQGSVPR